MRRYHLQTLSLILMWVGAIEVVASFLVHYLFLYTIPLTPWFFLALLVGLLVYTGTRIL